MQECQRQIAHWTRKLEVLRAQYRRSCLLLRLTEDPHTVWGLGDGALFFNDKEFVMASLRGDPLFFGCLREGQPFNEKMALELRNDPDVFLTFLKSMDENNGEIPERF